MLTIITGPIIPAGESLSDGVDCGGGNLVRLTMPSAWTPGGNLTFQVSTDGEYYNDFYDARGNEITFTVTPGAAIAVMDVGSWTRILGWIKFRSGTRDHPVVQEEQRDFAMTLETP